MNGIGMKKTRGGNFLKTLGNIGRTVAKVGVPILATEAGGPLAGAIASGAMSGLGVGKFKKGSAEAKAHMARIRAMRKTKGKGMFDVVKSVGKTVAKKALPVLVDVGADMAKQKLKTYLSDGEGLYKEVRQRKVKEPRAGPKRMGRVVNPRIKPQGRILINGIDQVEGGVNAVEGGSYGGFGYV